MILCPHQQQLHHASLPLALLILHSTIHTRVFFSAYWHLFLFHSIVTIYYILLFVVEGILWLVCGMSCHDVRCQVYIYLLTSTVLEVPHNNMFMDHPFLLFCHLLSSPLLSSLCPLICMALLACFFLGTLFYSYILKLEHSMVPCQEGATFTVNHIGEE